MSRQWQRERMRRKRESIRREREAGYEAGRRWFSDVDWNGDLSEKLSRKERRKRKQKGRR